MQLNYELLEKIKRSSQFKTNAFVLNKLFESGISRISISDLRKAGFKIEMVVNEFGNQSPESLVDEFPFYANYHFEGYSIFKDEESSLYDPSYKIERNSFRKLNAILKNMKMLHSRPSNIL